ncbi:Transcription factor SipA3, putative [Penicillium digitatum]|uniref:Transcription factor SipA3, putative n=3 Tax=Penicillium digitatum TaxID=36651 RepID=K9G714_PEND2|nr:Transcription factor SipA3, putative [Penicillium digitatum Pd1]EKV07563.1 Transcription factor SipA3, putative [Penicillium digitatum Pd1]EKV09001.1 Transcription factor SipA3, putative [Penicillium digitatum PHI26]QQK41248.1 Transcription factor SipA3, putative [Penicillium digitatum]
MSTQAETPLPQLGKLVSVVPVGLKEAALDSPTFRATTLHFSEQIDFIEKWLDGYAKAATKLSCELTTLESVVNNFLSYSTHPLVVSEAVVDHDYTLLAMRRCGEGSKDIWSGLITTTRKLESLISEPIRDFMQEDLRHFKEIRRSLDQTQKSYDYLQARYASQSKSKEASALREEAFQLHEAHKAYLKAAMDYSVKGPQVRNALDRLLVKVSCDQWREFRGFHDHNSGTFSKWTREMDRIKGWLHEMEGSEKSSKRELLSTRKHIEEAAEFAARPSRELEDYNLSTVPYLGSRPISTLNLSKDMRPEKQGWLYLRIFSGKPTRTVWVKRWAFLKHGIFGCLVQGSRTGGVEESERIGVLLCSIRPAFQEERRFCFQVKTKNNTILLQADNQKELMEWLGAFEAAKQKALENPASTDLSVSGKVTVQDPAFSISQPPASEFAADPADSLTPHTNDEPGAGDRSMTLPVPDRDGYTTRNSTDIGSGRRPTGLDSESSARELAREHTSRLIQKLDLHRRSNNAAPLSPSILGPAGGIASLISASHNILPSSNTGPPNVEANRGRSLSDVDEPGSSLAPATLANPPAPTNMSRAAVVVSNERGIGLGVSDSTGGMPSGMMANLWGSSNWGFMNKIQREQHNIDGVSEETPEGRLSSTLGDASTRRTAAQPDAAGASATPRQQLGPRHRQTVSLDGDDVKLTQVSLGIEHDYPSSYPQQLRIQDAQFRLLFPDVKRDEALVLVFRATWSPNDQQEFPGRAYVTTRNIYFYSHHFGLVLTTGVSLESIKEVTAAPGRDCDFLFLHTIPPLGSENPGRVTIKTFLEPLRLLQKRLNFLIQGSTAVEQLTLESLIKALLKMDIGPPVRNSSADSLEEISSGLADTKNDGGKPTDPSHAKDIRLPIYIDKDLELDGGRTGRGRDIAKFRLPAQPVEFVPQGDLVLVTEKILDISPKALFHILFGDKSAVWQLLLHERQARDIKQGPWASTELRHLRREFHYNIGTTDILGRTHENALSDYQIIDVLNDHLCYVVTDKKTPWHLPFRRSFRLVSKVVITFQAKSKSKLAIYTKVEWLWSPYGLRNVIDKKASDDLEQDALDLVDLVSDQVRRLGAHSRTKKAITIFGHVGRQSHVSHFSGAGSNLKLEPRKPRTQRAMHELLLETFLSFLETSVSFLMMWAFDVVRWSWKTVSAHKIILTMLATSALLNGYYSSRDSWDWWHERHAGNFMARLGVQPNLVMSKSIYMRDIDDAVANTTIWPGTGNTSDCFATFHEQTMRYSEMPLSLSASGPRDALTKSAIKRFQQTRERLGLYRHNLLVALRVVNSIEKEVIQTEWERWLREEVRRCRQVEVLLGKEATQGEDSQTGRTAKAERVFAEHADNVKQWYEEYCSSCRMEQEQVISNGRGDLIP